MPATAPIVPKFSDLVQTTNIVHSPLMTSKPEAPRDPSLETRSAHNVVLSALAHEGSSHRAVTSFAECPPTLADWKVSGQRLRVPACPNRFRCARWKAMRQGPHARIGAMPATFLSSAFFRSLQPFALVPSLSTGRRQESAMPGPSEDYSQHRPRLNCFIPTMPMRLTPFAP